jgi:glycosyltransferase involved in cell wall biosynthesis
MFCLYLNSEDSRGGAARAAYRLHEAMRGIGVDARMLVQVKHGDAGSVIGPTGAVSRLAHTLRPAADLVPLLRYPARQRATFYPGWLPDRVGKRVRELAPDLLHLHWITGGFLKVSSLKGLRMPMVWTLHDMWAFTGGCHYDGGCEKHKSRCGACPVLGSRRARDLSFTGWRRKQTAYRNLDLRLVAPSRWLADEAGRSSLLGQYPIRVIPNAIDTGQFRPIEKLRARELLGLPKEGRVILFGALFATSEARKGFQFLQPALRKLAARYGDVPLCAVVFGASQPASPPDFGMHSRYLGMQHDDISLALLYSAADVLVAPSVQENLSNAVMESMACGTPVVAFDVGGMPDLIDHLENGYLAKPFETDDLSEGIRWVIESESRLRELGARARKKVEAEYAMAVVARKYREVYEEAVSSPPAGRP